MGKMTDTRNRVGLQQDYLVGLDHLRKMVEGVEIELDKVKREYYNYEGSDLAGYEQYLKGLNDKFQYCNDNLEKRDITVEIVDSEMKLVALLNKIQENSDENFDNSVASDLTEFWEHIKDCLFRLKTTNLKFQTEVMKRLESTCNSYQNTGGSNLDFSTKYSEEAFKYQKEINGNVDKINALLGSFPNGIKQEHYTITNFSQRVLSSCDSRAFPILRLVPDISEKLVQMCRLARQWIDKDETYIHDINHQIREQRHNARQKELELRQQREKRSQLSRAVIECQQAVKAYRERLDELGKELRNLDQQFKEMSESKKYKKEEVKQKEGIIGFLEISISQTKKNYTLQLKKARILRQLKDLENNLKEIELEIEELEKEAESKRREREVVEEKIEENGQSFQTLKSDLDHFTEIVDSVQQEMNEMALQLQQLEIIQTFKTSPEKVDDFYDKPQHVKLAPSLKEKILRRRKLLASVAMNSGGTIEEEPESSFFLTH